MLLLLGSSMVTVPPPERVTVAPGPIDRVDGLLVDPGIVIWPLLLIEEPSMRRPLKFAYSVRLSVLPTVRLVIVSPTSIVTAAPESWMQAVAPSPGSPLGIQFAPSLQRLSPPAPIQVDVHDWAKARVPPTPRNVTAVAARTNTVE